MSNKYTKNDIFWYSEYKKPKYVLSIQPLDLFNWLNDKGFGRYVTNQRRTDSDSIVRYVNGTLQVHNLKSMKDFVVKYFKSADEKLFHKGNTLCVLYDDKYPVQGFFSKSDLLNRLSKDNLLTEYHYSYLQSFNTDNPKLFMDEKDKVYVKFRNKIVVVSKDSISEMDWNSDLNGSVWETEIIPHDIKINHNYKEGDGGLFEKFIQATCKVETETDGKEWFDNYTLDEENYQVLRNTYGYMISNHKSPTEGKCVVFIDKESDNFNANGGTGKSVVMNSIEYWKNTRLNDGKKKSSFDSKFLFSDVDYDTRFVHIQDLNKGFDFKILYNVINDTLEIEPKYKSKIFIPFEYSPKFGITTNYIDVDTNDHSTMRRQQIVEFGNYWKECVRKYHQSPQDETHLGKELFSKTQFTSDDWDEFYNYGFRCIQDYLKDGLVKSDLSDMKKKVMRIKIEGKNHTGEFDWIDNWLETERVSQGANELPGIRFDVLYGQFYNELGVQLGLIGNSYKTQFKRKLYDTCYGLGYEYNKHLQHKGDTPSARRYLLPNKENGGNDEYIYITKIGENPSILTSSEFGDTNTLSGGESVLNQSGINSFDNSNNFEITGSSDSGSKEKEFEDKWESIFGELTNNKEVS